MQDLWKRTNWQAPSIYFSFTIYLIICHEIHVFPFSFGAPLTTKVCQACFHGWWKHLHVSQPNKNDRKNLVLYLREPLWIMHRFVCTKVEPPQKKNRKATLSFKRGWCWWKRRGSLSQTSCKLNGNISMI